VGASKHTTGYTSKELARDAKRALDDRLQLINPQLPMIKGLMKEKFPHILVPWADEELPEPLRKIEVENPGIKIPRISDFGYHSLADALYFSIIIDENKRNRYPGFSLEKCRQVIDATLDDYRENCHLVLMGLLSDVIGDLGDQLLQLIEDKFGPEAAQAYRSTVKKTLDGDEPLFAFDEQNADGIASNNGIAPERWRSGDVGKMLPWTRIIDIASAFCNVNLDDLFEALLCKGEDELENELELATAPVKQLTKLTRKLLTAELVKAGSSPEELNELITQRQRKYTPLELDVEHAEAAAAKVLKKVPFCVDMVDALLLHRVASKVYAVQRKVDPLLRPFKRTRFYKKYEFACWLFDKSVHSISYKVLDSSSRLYGIVGLFNGAYYAKEKPGVFKRISEASGTSPLAFRGVSGYAGAVTGKMASDTRVKEDKEKEVAS
jgi:hypothetical protein